MPYHQAIYEKDWIFWYNTISETFGISKTLDPKDSCSCCSSMESLFERMARYDYDIKKIKHVVNYNILLNQEWHSIQDEDWDVEGS